MAIYNLGTASVTSGSATVAGSGTTWAVSAVAGGVFNRNGFSGIIASVTSDTELVLARPAPAGMDGTGVYDIAYLDGIGLGAEALARLNENVAALRGLSPLGRDLTRRESAASMRDAIRALGKDGDEVTGITTFGSSGPMSSSVQGRARMEARALDNQMAAITLHRPGSILTYFGLDTDNALAWGGGSFGNMRHRVWEDSQAARLLQNNGFQRLPSGLILQWGHATFNSPNNDPNMTGNVVFPMTFPGQFSAFICGGVTDTNGDGRVLGTPVIYNRTQSGCSFDLRNNVTGVAISGILPYLAIGF